MDKSIQKTINNNIKIAFFDVDNTLFDHKVEKWVSSSIEAIKELQKRGIKCFACTARSYYNAKLFGIMSSGIKWDGGVYAAGSTGFIGHKVLYTESLSIGEGKRFLKLLKDNKIVAEVVGTKSVSYSSKLNEYVHDYRKMFPDKCTRVRKYDGKPITCFLVFAPEEFDQKIKELFPDVYLFRFHPHGVDVKGRHYQKGDGIVKILNYYGFKKEEAIGFGDDIQDISIAENVGTFIAVGNAKEEVKKKATCVCEPIDKDGIANYLKEVKLI